MDILLKFHIILQLRLWPKLSFAQYVHSIYKCRFISKCLYLTALLYSVNKYSQRKLLLLILTCKIQNTDFSYKFSPRNCCYFESFFREFCHKHYFISILPSIKLLVNFLIFLETTQTHRANSWQNTTTPLEMAWDVNVETGVQSLHVVVHVLCVVSACLAISVRF